MFNNVQYLYQNIGSKGCLVLCYIHIAEKITGKEIDAPRAILRLIQLGYVSYDTADRTGNKMLYVEDAEGVMYALTGQKYSVLKSTDIPADKNGVYIIREYAYTSTGITRRHFNCEDFEPYNDSITKKYGLVVGYRLIKKSNV